LPYLIPPLLLWLKVKGLGLKVKILSRVKGLRWLKVYFLSRMA